MGKIACEICGKKCKGEVLKLQDKYFHTDCFKCKECKTQLSEGEFFLKDGKYYCPSDYQKLFGTQCYVCRKFVEGEVVTALGNTFHPDCFKCKNCGKSFHAGDKVSFNGSDYYCKPCAEQLESPNSPASPSRAKNHVSRPVMRTSTPRRTVDGEVEVDHNNEIITPTEHSQLHTLQYRTPSPGSSSIGSRSSSSSFHRQSRTESDHELHHDVNYGKMYPKSYLEKENGKKTEEEEEKKRRDMYKRSSSPSYRPPKSPHFHRPENFHFSRVKQAFVYPGGKKGHADKASDTPRGKSPTPMNNEEPIKLSTFPDGHEPGPNEKKRIERDDWPGPPSPASILPALIRNKKNSLKDENEDEEDGVEVPEDPKILREIEEISKFKKSGMSQVILRDLEEKKKKRAKSPPLDPWLASRTPSATYEPDYKTRYDSPIFASPSRDRDRQRIIYEESLLNKDRSATLPGYPGSSSLSSLRHAYSGSSIKYNIPVAKPGYTYGLAAKSASLPGSARSGVSLERYKHPSDDDVHSNDDDDDNDDEGEYDGNHHVEDGVQMRRAPYKISTSSMDGNAGLKNTQYIIRGGGRYHGAHYSEVLNHTVTNAYFRRSLPNVNAEPKKSYSYDDIKITNELPKDVDRNVLERYLNKEDFEKIFNMTREEFYRMAEWRRNDLKKRVDLY